MERNAPGTAFLAFVAGGHLQLRKLSAMLMKTVRPGSFDAK